MFHLDIYTYLSATIVQGGSSLKVMVRRNSFMILPNHGYIRKEDVVRIKNR